MDMMLNMGIDTVDMGNIKKMYPEVDYVATQITKSNLANQITF